MRTVYLDTTIHSYYVERRPQLRLHTQRTRQWWDFERAGYLLYTSQTTLDELAEGRYPHQEEALGLMKGIPVLRATPEVEQAVETYLANRLMPVSDLRDATHLAFASCYKLDFLLTWNCGHLANANKRRHIEVVNSWLQIASPAIITPLELVPLEAEP